MLVLEQIASKHADARIVRMSYLYGVSGGAWDRRLAAMQAAASSGHGWHCFVDAFRSPIWVREAAREIVLISALGTPGVYHIASKRVSICDFYRAPVTHWVSTPACLDTSFLQLARLSVDMERFLARDTQPDG